MIAAVGLWRLRRYGFVASLFVAGFSGHAWVEILVEVFQERAPYALEIVLPQIAAVAVAITLIVYLWNVRSLFRWS
jgi:hypothetical protein